MGILNFRMSAAAIVMASCLAGFQNCGEFQAAQANRMTAASSQSPTSSPAAILNSIQTAIQTALGSGIDLATLTSQQLQDLLSSVQQLLTRAQSIDTSTLTPSLRQQRELLIQQLTSAISQIQAAISLNAVQTTVQMALNSGTDLATLTSQQLQNLLQSAQQLLSQTDGIDPTNLMPALQQKRELLSQQLTTAIGQIQAAISLTTIQTTIQMAVGSGVDLTKLTPQQLQDLLPSVQQLLTQAQSIDPTNLMPALQQKRELLIQQLTTAIGQIQAILSNVGLDIPWAISEHSK